MTCTETRKGFTFDNPDISSDYLAPKWGLLVTADDLRYDLLFGNPLIAEADAASITDNQLNDYARMAITYMERELNIDILPRRIRYEDPIDKAGDVVVRTDFDDSSITSKMNRKQLSALYIREAGYPYRTVAARHECRVKLRRRPVRDVLTANFVDPFFGNTLINLMPYRIVKKGLTGACYFRPRQITTRLHSFQYIWNTYIFAPYGQDRQNIFMLDYDSGYENCQDVPDDIRYIVRLLAACTLMNIYGDGKFAAIASRSVSLNSVHESIGTTLSATSAAFGARLIEYRKEIKGWFDQNRAKYSRTIIGTL